jgi:hypothetical protein
MKKQKTFHYAKYPRKVSQAAESYITASSRTTKLFVFFIDLILSGDYATHIAKKALEGKKIDKKLNPTKLAKIEPGPRTKLIRELNQELLETFFSRMVDSFEVYLVDILREVLKQRPQILSNRQQTLTIEYVLQFPTKEELITDLIETKVNSLSYKGFADLVTWFKERGIPLSVNEESMPKIVELIATRNIIVHNRGRVDSKYFRGNPSTIYPTGSIRTLDVDYFFEAIGLLNSLVAMTDPKIVKKFSLATLSFEQIQKVEVKEETKVASPNIKELLGN